jgi:hypothetical protein
MELISFRFLLTHLGKDIPLEEVVDEIKDFDTRFTMILERHVVVLVWWCILNFAVGIPSLVFSTGWFWYFMLMNISWGVINLAIALHLFDHFYLKRFFKGNVYHRLETTRHVEKMLLFNVGLDLAYIFAGLWLLTYARVPDVGYPELWWGFGWATVLQGAYLFIQDLIFHGMHRSNMRKCEPFMENILEEKLKANPGKIAAKP